MTVREEDYKDEPPDRHEELMTYRDGFECYDCGGYAAPFQVCLEMWDEVFPDYDRVKKALVAKHGHGRASLVTLCLTCLEKRCHARYKRSLKPEDFVQDTRINEMYFLGIKHGAAEAAKATRLLTLSLSELHKRIEGLLKELDPFQGGITTLISLLHEAERLESAYIEAESAAQESARMEEE